jgi:hypothetical protein
MRRTFKAFLLASLLTLPLALAGPGDASAESPPFLGEWVTDPSDPKNPREDSENVYTFKEGSLLAVSPTQRVENEVEYFREGDVWFACFNGRSPVKDGSKNYDCQEMEPIGPNALSVSPQNDPAHELSLIRK